MVFFARLSSFVSGRFLGFFWVIGSLHGFSVGPNSLNQSVAECLLGTRHRIA